MGALSQETLSHVNDQLASDGGNYLKLSELAEKGQKIRILKPPVVGTEYWTDKDGVRKPKRVEPGTQIMIGDVAPNQYGDKPIKPWWGMAVYVHDTNQVGILNVTQKTVMRALTQLDTSDEWGDFTTYDLKITKEEGQFTSYNVTPLKPADLPEKAQETIEANPIDLEQLYATQDNPNGGNPFGKKTTKATDTTIDPDDLPF